MWPSFSRSYVNSSCIGNILHLEKLTSAKLYSIRPSVFVRSVASFLCRHILREDPKLLHLSNPKWVRKEKVGVPRTNPVGTGPVAQRIRVD